MTSNRLALAEELAAVASKAALSVAGYLRDVTRTVTSHETKRDVHDPVTIHDREAERRLRTFLGSAIPGSRLLGEEFGDEILSKGRGEQQDGAATDGSNLAVLGPRVRWIVDPIDGTANFAAGSIYFGTSVGVELDGEMVAGAITIPFTGELFYADLKEAWHVDRGGTRTRMKAQGPRTEREALLVSYHPRVHAIRENPEQSLKDIVDLARAFMVVRKTGASALDLAQVAAGWQGALLGGGFEPWDMAAGIHMVRVAGGRVLNLGSENTLPDGLRPGVLAMGANLDAPTAERVLRELMKGSEPSS